MHRRRLDFQTTSSRSVSREKSQSNKTGGLKRDDPQIKARLDNLVKSASLYRTKACGVIRNPSSGRKSSSHFSQMSRGSIAPSTRVVIECPPSASGLSTHRTTGSSSMIRGRSRQQQYSNQSASLMLASTTTTSIHNTNLPNTTTNKNLTRKSVDSNYSQQNIVSVVQRNNRNSSRSYLQSYRKDSSVLHNSLSITSTKPIAIPSYREDQNMIQTSNSQSIKSFSEDAEFIEFLKNISLFVTNGDSPRDQSSTLYKNLQFLRDKFKEYKQKKSTINTTSSYLGDFQQTTNNIETTTNKYPIFDQNNQTIQSSDKNYLLSTFDNTNKIQHQPPFSFNQTETLSYKTPQSTKSSHNNRQNIAQTSKQPTTKQSDKPKPNFHTEQLQSLPEKQRKQIEFIDDIYEKVVLNKGKKNNPNTSSNLINSNEEQEDKENIGFFGYKQPLNFEISSRQVTEPDQETDNFLFPLDKSSRKDYNKFPNQQQMLNSSKLSKNHSEIYLYTPTGASQSIMHDQNQSTYSFPNHSQNSSSQIEETLKTLNETAQQLKQACLGINQFANQIIGTQMQQNAPMNSSNNQYKRGKPQETDSTIITPREYSNPYLVQQHPHPQLYHNESLASFVGDDSALRERKDIYNRGSGGNYAKTQNQGYKSQNRKIQNTNIAKQIDYYM